MAPFGLNHMTMPNASTTTVLDRAQSLGFAGVELRNDLANPLFDNKDPEFIREKAREQGLRIFALAEVYAFNDNSEESRQKILSLIDLARACGAEAIVLIPRLLDSPISRDAQRQLLKSALGDLVPLLENSGVKALIEPLGFPNSSLRFKADVILTLAELGDPDCFALIHDTFHHALAGEAEVFAQATSIVHISGVADTTVDLCELTDAHRGLVDGSDRLGNIEQISQLKQEGYTGPFSFEAFAPEIHAMNDPKAALSVSTAFITSQVGAVAA